MKNTLIIFIIAIISQQSFSQQIGSIYFNEERLQMRVKQLEEFMERFNYEKDIKGNRIENKNDTVRRMNYILSLFNQDYLKKQSQKQLDTISNFLKQVCTSQNPVLIDYKDENWYAVTLCKIKYFGKVKTLQVILQTSIDSMKYEKWVIAGVKADFLTIKTQKPDSIRRFLSPISHEINFLKLGKAAKNDKEYIASYAYNSYKSDELSVFFWLIKNNKLQIEYVKNITYHFLQVPNWIFTVEKFERDTDNSGWLISNIKYIPEKNKDIYIQSNFNILTRQ